VISTAIDVTRTRVPSSIERWYVLILMCLIYAINIADRYVVSTVLEPIRLDLHLDDDSVGMLTSWPLALFYVTCGIPISWFADRSNRRNILSVSLIVWSGFTALCGLSRGWIQFALARIGAGIGEAGGTPPSTAIVSDCFPPDRRPMAMTVLALGAPIGAWIALDVAGEVARIYDWRHAFLALGVPGLVVGLIVYLTIREPPRGHLDEIVDDIKPSVKETWRFFWEQKAAFHVVMGGGLCALWGWGLMYWTPAFLMRTYQIDVAQASDVGQHSFDRGLPGHGGYRLAVVEALHGGPAPRGMAARRSRRADHDSIFHCLLDALPLRRKNHVLDFHSRHLLLYRSLLRAAQQSFAMPHAVDVHRSVTTGCQRVQSDRRAQNGGHVERLVCGRSCGRCVVVAHGHADSGSHRILGGLSFVPGGQDHHRRSKEGDCIHSGVVALKRSVWRKPISTAAGCH
jgi:MFS family permease